MTQKIRVGAVSYLNTKPLIYGFEQGQMKEEIDLIMDYPAKIASLLVEDKIDIGLVPVAITPSLKEYHIVSDYGISCDGEVASVCLFSDVPLHEIDTVLLDYQSKTSVALLRILLQEHWNISPQLIAGNASYENDIKGTTAGLVIGDRALAQRSRSKFIYDLGTAWKQMTGLPFVFAAWISNKAMTDDFITQFDKANEVGLRRLENIVHNFQTGHYNLLKYYTENIQYGLDDKKKEGMQLFLQKVVGLAAFENNKILK